MKRFPKVDTKIIFTALVIVILPAIVIAATAAKFYDTKSRAYHDGGDGGLSIRCTNGSLNDCGGVYNISKNPDGLNFGDPKCELVSGEDINKQMIRNEIMNQLQALGKTKDYCRWACIAHREAGYDPNSYNPNSSRKIGAWGLFQITPWACYSSDKPYYYNRTGNVSWKEQISRAFLLEYKALEPNNLDWNYWSTYKNTCHKEPNWSPGVTCLNIGGDN